MMPSRRIKTSKSCTATHVTITDLRIVASTKAPTSLTRPCVSSVLLFVIISQTWASLQRPPSTSRAGCNCKLLLQRRCVPKLGPSPTIVLRVTACFAAFNIDVYNPQTCRGRHAQRVLRLWRFWAGGAAATMSNGELLFVCCIKQCT